MFSLKKKIDNSSLKKKQYLQPIFLNMMVLTHKDELKKSPVQTRRFYSVVSGQGQYPQRRCGIFSRENRIAVVFSLQGTAPILLL